jgi:hypothetical protein
MASMLHRCCWGRLLKKVELRGHVEQLAARFAEPAAGGTWTRVVMTLVDQPGDRIAHRAQHGAVVQFVVVVHRSTSTA